MVDTTTQDWKASLTESAALNDKGSKYKARAGMLLWSGAQAAITEWLPESGTDVGGETLYSEAMAALGKARKGDASKIKTVALAVKEHGLVLKSHKNLAKAYGEAQRLLSTVPEHAAEDTAIEAATKALAESAPKSASTPESAAKIVLAQGPSNAAKLLLDALGAEDGAAHRALIRALAAEAASRVKPVVKATKATAPKGAATKAKSGGTARKAAVAAQDGATKPKGAPVAKGAGDKPVGVAPKAKPVSLVKAKPVAVKPVVAPVTPVPVQV